MGFGSTIIESTQVCLHLVHTNQQNKLLAHWFSGSHLALVFALDIAWSRVQTVITRSTAVPLSQIGDNWGWALYVPTIICAANLALCIGYYFFERNIPKQYRPVLGREARNKEGWDRRKFVFRSLFKLPKFFWILCGTRESTLGRADGRNVPKRCGIGVYVQCGRYPEGDAGHEHTCGRLQCQSAGHHSHRAYPGGRVVL